MEYSILIRSVGGQKTGRGSRAEEGGRRHKTKRNESGPERERVETQKGRVETCLTAAAAASQHPVMSQGQVHTCDLIFWPQKRRRNSCWLHT